MKRVHRLSESELVALARGHGAASTIERLRTAQISKRLLLLRELRKAARSPWFDEHFSLLGEVQLKAPDVFSALLGQPHVGAWLATALRRVRGVLTREYPVEAELAYLGWAAGSAAIQAGMEFKIDVPVRDGVVMLPGLGRALITDAPTATLRRQGREAWVGVVKVPEQPEHDAPGWQGLRHVRSTVDGLKIRLCLDDIDPYRDSHRLKADERLDPETMARWQSLLDEAWPLLVHDHRPYAEGMAEGLVTVVPLRTTRADRGMNVTSMDAFGAVSLSRPASGHGLALGLLHEFQHGKLGALIDIVQLYERDDRPRYYAPWRDDPRPIGALLQGAYAFQGVADFWRTQRHGLAGGEGRFAQVEFVRWRDRVWRTLEVLESSGRFTEIGRRFLTGMRTRQQPWQDEPAPADTVAEAAEAAEDHWIGWLLRNRRPDPVKVAWLAGVWRTGGSCPSTMVPVVVEAGERNLAQSVRLDLAQLRITDPERFDMLCADPTALKEAVPDATSGDVALAQRDHNAARDEYATEIVEDPTRLDSWIGLTLACRRGGDEQLMRFPELCHALYLQLPANQVDPVELAGWLRSVAAPDHD